MDLVTTFEKVNAMAIPFEIAPRRPGDIATCYAEAGKAKHTPTLLLFLGQIRL